jgi:hypothetical protein
MLNFMVFRVRWLKISANLMKMATYDAESSKPRRFEANLERNRRSRMVLASTLPIVQQGGATGALPAAPLVPSHLLGIPLCIPV